MTTLAGDRRAPPRPTACLAACMVAASVALLTAAFEWTLIDQVPGLMFLPGHIVLSLLPLGASLVWAGAELRNVRRSGLWHAVPLAVCLGAVAALQFMPFTRIWLDANFWWHRAEREHIVAEIEQEQLKPNVAHNAALIALPKGSGHLSAGGNEVKFEVREGKAWVLFFTFRGINHYSGFLRVPEGGDPESFADLADRRHQVVPFGPGWYFVAR